MRGIEPAAGEIPGKTGKSAKRAERREERAADRNDLYERYAAQKAAGGSAAAEQRKAFSRMHKEERQALTAALARDRKTRIPDLVRQHGKQVAFALWAAERARALQTLQARQQIERSALRRTSDMSWKAWVEREAASGDPASQAALRGLRYREQRRTKPLPGFEGEDLEDSMDAPAARGEGGQRNASISGTVKAFDLSRYEIDRLRQIIIYRDEHGNVALEDMGQRIECRQHQDDAVIRAGLLLSAQKYGGEVVITGDDAFKARAAEIARQAGVRVVNTELQQPHGRGQQWHER